MAQFDNDYDIFYPLVKNKIVYDNQSLRDILLSYCKDENELVQIEQSLPLLNILVMIYLYSGILMQKNGMWMIKKYP